MVMTEATNSNAHPEILIFSISQYSHLEDYNEASQTKAQID